MSGKSTEDNELVQRSVLLPATTDNILRKLAFDKRISKSDLIRRFIDLGIAATSEPATAGDEF